MNDSSLFEFQVNDFAFGGMAVGKLDSGKVCFLRGAAPGELVLAKTEADKKTHRFASLVKVLKPSPRRSATGCPFAPAPDAEGLGWTRQCPGCSYRHVPYEDELAAKQAQLKDFVTRWLKLEADSLVKAPCPAPSRDGWRNKIVLTCEGKHAGYKASDNQTLVAIDDCPLAKPGIRKLLKELKADLPDGTRISFRETAKDGALSWSGKPEKAAELLTEKLPQGEFLVPRGSFFQVNDEVAGKLIAEAVKTVAGIKPDVLLDMYCGVGVFSIACAKAAGHVEGCELDGQAIEAAKRNAKDRGLDNCRFIADDAAKAIARLAKAGRRKNTALLLDPPRGGLEPEALKAVCALQPENLLYVSCAADALCRDMKALFEAGYKLKSLRLFDLFPSTAHFETFAHLERT